MKQPRQTRDTGSTQADLAMFLTAKEGAAFLRLSSITLSRWRAEGVGPAYRKFGRRVLYAKADLVQWADRCQVIPKQIADTNDA